MPARRDGGEIVLLHHIGDRGAGRGGISGGAVGAAARRRRRQSSGLQPLTDQNSSFNRNRTDSFSGSVGIYRGRHNFTFGGDLRKQQYNDYYQQNPRGIFTFTGAATQGIANGVATGGVA